MVSSSGISFKLSVLKHEFLCLFIIIIIAGLKTKYNVGGNLHGRHLFSEDDVNSTVRSKDTYPSQVFLTKVLYKLTF